MLFQKYQMVSASAKAGLWFVVCSCIQSGIKFISLPIFASLMSVEQYGIVTLYTSWSSIIQIFATLCLGTSTGVFYVAMVKFPNDRNEFTSSMNGLVVVASFATLLVLLLSEGLLGDWMGIGIYSYPMMVLEQMGYGFILLWSLRKRFDNAYRPLLLVTFVFSALSVLIPVILICLFSTTTISPSFLKITGEMLATILVGIVVFADTWRQSQIFFSQGFWKFAMCFNFPLIPHYLSSVVLVQSDRILIAWLIDASAAAIYAVAYTLGVAVQVITNALINVVNPWVYKHLESRKEHLVGKSIIFLVIAVGLLILSLLCVMPELFDCFFSTEYASALLIVPPVAISVLWSFIAYMYISLELYFEMSKFVSVISIAGAALNVVLNLIFIPCFGIEAAAYTTMFCNFIYAVLHCLFTYHLLRKNKMSLSVLPAAPLFGCGICFTLIALLISLTYAYPLFRYGFFGISMLFIYIFKNRLFSIVRKQCSA